MSASPEASFAVGGGDRRTYAIADLHGRLDLLQAAYDAIALDTNGNPCAPTLQSAIAEKDAEIGRLRECERELHATVRKFNCDDPAKFWERIAQLRARAERAGLIARLTAERDGDVAKAVAAEREACAKAAEMTRSYDDNLQRSAGCATSGQRIAASIRARAAQGESDG